MEKVMKSDERFRRDFKDISFGGATIVDGGGRELIGFKLYCNFKKNININETQKEK
jgi:hypothetical protein